MPSKFSQLVAHQLGIPENKLHPQTVIPPDKLREIWNALPSEFRLRRTRTEEDFKNGMTYSEMIKLTVVAVYTTAIG